MKRPDRNPVPKISAAEWDIMAVLWEHPDSDLEAAQVFAALPHDRQWAQKTVNTFLTRLAEKGAVRIGKRGHKNVYRAIVASEDCVRHEAQSFLERVFRGQTGPMLMHYLKHESLSPEEIEHLKNLLDEKSS